MAKVKEATGYHVVKVTCKADRGRPKSYIAGFTNRQRKHGFKCVRCSASPPYGGDSKHTVSSARSSL